MHYSENKRLSYCFLYKKKATGRGLNNFSWTFFNCVDIVIIINLRYIVINFLPIHDRKLFESVLENNTSSSS